MLCIMVREALAYIALHLHWESLYKSHAKQNETVC